MKIMIIFIIIQLFGVIFILEQIRNILKERKRKEKKEDDNTFELLGQVRGVKNKWI